MKKDTVVASSNNVIVFPKHNPNVTGSMLKSIEEVQNNINMARHYHIQETIANIAPLIFNQLEVSGFNFPEETDDDDIREGAFLVESLRSMLCRYYGIYHPFQKITKSVFIPDDEEEDTLRIVDSINISLKNDKK
jgi:hypothetical protein